MDELLSNSSIGGGSLVGRASEKAMDKKVGELISQLEEDGLLENTIIMFWSDHGGNLLRQKRAVGNSGLNVPLIIRYPNKMDAGKVDNRIVSLMDLGPTVLSYIPNYPGY